MLKLHKDLPKAETPHEQESLQRQIAATDKAIDALVYQLCGLTEGDIGIVEGGRKLTARNLGIVPELRRRTRP